MTNRLVFALIASLCVALCVPAASAQVGKGSWGVGVHVGDPTGLTLRTYTSRPVRGGGALFDAVDLVFGWDIDQYFFGNGHVLQERLLGTGPLNYYLGPGVFLGFRDDPDRVFLGISGAFGINYFFERFEFFLQLVPRLALVEATDLELGGGFGVRYYFQ